MTHWMLRTSILSCAAILALTGLTAAAQNQTAPLHFEPEVPPDAHFAFRTAAGEEGPGEDHLIQFLSAGYSLAPNVVTGAPYSAEAVTEIVQTLGDGNRIVRKNTALIYRDNEGRTRQEQQLEAIGPWAHGGESAKMIFIHDPVAGVHYVLDPRNTTASKMSPPHLQPALHLQGEAAASERGAAIRAIRIQAGPAGGNDGVHQISVMNATAGISVNVSGTAQNESNQESLGNRIMEGLEVQGTRTTTTIPAGAIGNELPITIVSERWYSPELQAVVLTKRNDPRFGETIYRLSNVQRVEPLPSMFEVPTHYTIRTSQGGQAAAFKWVEREPAKSAPPR